MRTDEAITFHMSDVASRMTRRAHQAGVFNGHNTPLNMAAMERCRYTSYETRTRLIFTRDGNHHASGWWKNPEYERCFHLSLSPAPALVIIPGALTELNTKTRDAWLKAFYGEHVNKVWAESPYSPEGKKHNVWHYRVFCDEHWQPIIPRKEVYSKEFTPAGWMSYSDLVASELAKEAEEESRA